MKIPDFLKNPLWLLLPIVALGFGIAIHENLFSDSENAIKIATIIGKEKKDVEVRPAYITTLPFLHAVPAQHEEFCVLALRVDGEVIDFHPSLPPTSCGNGNAPQVGSQMAVRRISSRNSARYELIK